MTEQELTQQRREKWRLDGRPIRTYEEAAEFVESVGFCLMYPLPKQEAGQAMELPTFLGAWAGTDEKLPTWQHAFSDPRAQEATEMMIRLLRQRAAFEANLFGETNFLVAASIFPYFYALVGDRNPRQTLKAGKHSEYSPLARDAFEGIREKGPVSRQALRNLLGGDVSSAALDRALSELWSKLRITRVDYHPLEGTFWDALYRQSPEAVREGMSLSVVEGLSALISKYLDCMVAADLGEIELFFSHMVARSRVKEAVNALLTARELSFVHSGKRSLIEVAPPPGSLQQHRMVNQEGRKSIGSRMMTEGERKLIVAIDGPAGAGKSTIASRLARKFGYVNLETGAMYRALALKAIQSDVSFDDEEALVKLAGNSHIELEPKLDGNRISLDGVDVSARIRDTDVSQGASKVAVHPKVRTWMVERQREMGAGGGVVMEGRDVGTKIFPDADVKIFLQADPEVRVQRRLKQGEEEPTAQVVAAQVAAEIRQRDQRDKLRKASPLSPAADAIVLDSTHMTIEQVVDRVEEIIVERNRQNLRTPPPPKG